MLKLFPQFLLLLITHQTLGSQPHNTDQWQLNSPPIDITRINVDGSPKIAFIVEDDKASFYTLDIQDLSSQPTLPALKSTTLGNEEMQPMIIQEIFPQCLITSKNLESSWRLYLADGIDDFSHFKENKLLEIKNSYGILVENHKFAYYITSSGVSVFSVNDNDCNNINRFISRRKTVHERFVRLITFHQDQIFYFSNYLSSTGKKIGYYSKTKRKIITSYNIDVTSSETIQRFGVNNHPNHFNKILYFTKDSSSQLKNKMVGMVFNASYKHEQTFYAEETDWDLLDIKEVNGTDHLIMIKIEGEKQIVGLIQLLENDIKFKGNLIEQSIDTSIPIKYSRRLITIPEVNGYAYFHKNSLMMKKNGFCF